MQGIFLLKSFVGQTGGYICTGRKREGKISTGNFTFFRFYDIVAMVLSKTDDRGCRCRKAAGEESPGFIGQDAR